MNLILSIVCTECDRHTTVPIEQDEKGKRYLSDSIEQQQEEFYCNLNSQYSMQINCTCGNEITMYY